VRNFEAFKYRNLPPEQLVGVGIPVNLPSNMPRRPRVAIGESESESQRIQQRDFQAGKNADFDRRQPKIA
jgi:hypothetical protein